VTSGDNVGGWARPAGSDPTPGLVPQYLPAPPMVPSAPPPASALPASAPPAFAPPQQQYWAPQPYYYAWVPQPVVVAPPPKRSNGWVRWLVSIMAIVVILATLAFGGLVALAQNSGALDTQAAWRPAGAAAPAPDLPPAANAPTSEWARWARRAVDDALVRQSEALLAGDEKGFVGVADPSNTKLVADLKRRFGILHAMGPGVWRQFVNAPLRTEGSRSWSADVRISYCFGDPGCRSADLVVASAWEAQDDHIAMVKLSPSEERWNGPRPWEIDALSVKTGKNVVIATTKANAWRLNDAAASADKAAAVADTLAKWEAPPSRFVIFLAGPSEWKRWYGHDQPEWAAAWAVPVGPTVTEVVVRTEVVHQSDLQQLLTHELTHVTTLAGKRDGAGRSAWWLIEGIAEYATMIGHPISDYDAISPTRSFVHGTWNGDPAVTPPAASASLKDASARYGIGFLSVRWIAQKYGQDKMLDFFGHIVHDGDTNDAAAKAALGTSWSVVKAGCVSFIRKSV
jgi:hypothetical protein